MAKDRGAGSQIFAPFRALGHITDDVPFFVQQKGTADFVTVAIDKTFQIFNCAKLNIVCVGPQLPKRVAAVAAEGDLTFVASGNDVLAFKRSTLVHTLRGHSGTVRLLLTFGAHVLSVGDDRRLIAWDVAGESEVASVELGSKFTPSCILHPATYLNKVVLGSREGPLQLWNVRSCKLVYSFAGWGVEVRCMEQSPAVDVVGVGLADGRAVVHNLKADQTLMSFTQAEGPVTSLSFRTDGQAVLATGTTAGGVHLWDLEKRRLLASMKECHDAAVACVRFLNGEPVLLTSGADNALRMWLFDQADGTGRPLRGRSGHSAPPTRLRYYGTDSYNLLSAGLDRSFRLFCTIQESQSCELSQGRVAKKARIAQVPKEELKLPPVVAFDACSLRERDWANIVTAHEGHPAAYTWRWETKALGQHRLPTTDGTPVKCVALSTCGNFAYVGSAGGVIDRYNLQSGIHRATYKQHRGPVTGICAEDLNKQLVTGGHDGTLRIWNAKTGALETKVKLGSAVVRMALGPEGTLLAVACEDLVIRVYDMVSCRVARRFTGHTNLITDLVRRRIAPAGACYSDDGRWLISSSTDSTIRTWDLPAGRPIDAFRTATAATSLALSPANDYLATTHVGSTGIHLWSNRLQFSAPFLRPPPDLSNPRALPLPTASGAPGEDDDEGGGGGLEAGEGEEGDVGDGLPRALASEAVVSAALRRAEGRHVTLSGAPRARWQTLADIDVIKERNRPREGPKAPEAAPFFLPTLPGLQAKFGVAPGPSGAAGAGEENGAGEDESARKRKKRVGKLGSLLPSNRLAGILRDCAEAGGPYDAVVGHLSALGPAQVDLEIRSLPAPPEDEACTALVDFLAFAAAHLERRRDFELVQAYLNVFLRAHGDLIPAVPALREAAAAALDAQRGVWGALDDLFQHCLCLVADASGAQM